jgi:hypothetical protein|tara:strand:- start:240 stop:467 length:228 start_codon:yes stop_codon:yes gene_type:complete
MGDNDFPIVMANGGWDEAKDKASKWKEYRSGSSSYSQSGTHIPTGSMYSQGEFADGSDMSPLGYEEFGVTPSLLF